MQALDAYPEEQDVAGLVRSGGMPRQGVTWG